MRLSPSRRLGLFLSAVGILVTSCTGGRKPPDPTDLELPQPTSDTTFSFRTYSGTGRIAVEDGMVSIEVPAERSASAEPSDALLVIDGEVAVDAAREGGVFRAELPCRNLSAGEHSVGVSTGDSMGRRLETAASPVFEVTDAGCAFS